MHTRLFEIKVASKGIDDGPRLFMDFLEHEMLVSRLFGHHRIPVNPYHRPLPPFPAHSLYRVPATPQAHQIVVFQVDHPICIWEDRRHIGREVQSIVANSQDQRAFPARRDKLIGMLLVDKNHRIAPAQLAESIPDRRQVVLAPKPFALGQLDNHFCIGL